MSGEFNARLDLITQLAGAVGDMDLRSTLAAAFCNGLSVYRVALRRRLAAGQSLDRALDELSQEIDDIAAQYGH